MNQHQTITPPALHERDFVLATDLDGTFLGGSEDDRETLYGWIEDNRATIGLVFVTGRDPEFIADICDGTSVPWPDYVIGDVGTTIAKVDAGGSIAPIGALEEDIARRWGDQGGRVRETLDGHPGLTLQATPFRYRVSYDLDAAGYHPGAEDKIAALGLDHLISDNRFFDVLPKGVSKGPSLKRLVAHLGIDGQRVLAAGDTLNDLSMLECGLPAVAVGNAEDALVERVSPLDHVFMASAHGAGGILEAVAAFNLHPTPKG
jgi:hydroxymethylpyrimidine pyrophosphatase-like HAD family hydrolase